MSQVRILRTSPNCRLTQRLECVTYNRVTKVRLFRRQPNADLAQLVVQLTCNQQVTGSIPVVGTSLDFQLKFVIYVHGPSISWNSFWLTRLTKLVRKWLKYLQAAPLKDVRSAAVSIRKTETTRHTSTSVIPVVTVPMMIVSELWISTLWEPCTYQAIPIHDLVSEK